jgi:hypothetical protein
MCTSIAQFLHHATGIYKHKTFCDSGKLIPLIIWQNKVATGLVLPTLGRWQTRSMIPLAQVLLVAGVKVQVLIADPVHLMVEKSTVPPTGSGGVEKLSAPARKPNTAEQNVFA